MSCIFYYFCQSQEKKYTSLKFYTVATKLFNLGQTFHLSFHIFSTTALWNLVPLLQTELL